ncbi:MAG: hypothetical protein IJY25_01630 [Bacilli bacterium]|nr:hypothetical protein [Bacilli bacterium]
MELDVFLKIMLIGVSLFALIFFVFGLARIDWDTDVDSVLNIYRSELKRTEEELNKGNKKIDEIEKEIFKCKKKLNRL